MKKLKKRLIRIILGFVLFVLAFVLDKTSLVQGYWQLLFYVPAYLVIGGDVLYKALRNIFRGKVLDENFLMCIATIGAYFTSEYAEAVAVMFFYQVGELFQSYAVNRSRKSIADLMDIRPDYANIDREGQLTQVDPNEVAVGDVIVVKAGERIPLDGFIVQGQSSIDTSAMTGESMPRDVQTGDEVFSGAINLNGTLRIRVNRPFEQSTVSKVLELVENAASQKAASENFITKFARYYTPAVVIGAVLLAVIPSIIWGNWAEWVHRALTFLVISCPCALVISVPLSFFGGIGGASRLGILVKGGNYLEALAHAETVVMDKTGTLTKGTFEVSEIHPQPGISECDLLEKAAYAEHYCDHPIARSLKRAYGKDIHAEKIEKSEVLSGFGVCTVIENQKYFVGNQKLMQKEDVSISSVQENGTVVHVSAEHQYLGYIVISDQIKPTAKQAIADLKAAGIQHTVLLTGDSSQSGTQVAQQLGIDEVHTQLLPADKVIQLEHLMAARSSRGKVVFVGDGINDAPVIARSDVGVAMGGLGSDAAIEAADVVIMNDDPLKLVSAVQVARHTLQIVYQNIIFALVIKFLILILGALGYANMWAAVFADVGVAVLAILNAMRALNVRKFDRDNHDKLRN